VPAGILAFQMLAIEVRRQQRIGCRVPFAVVDAVQDPAQVARAPAQHALQAEPELPARLDLARVRGAHGGHHVGEQDADLHEVHAAVVFERAVREERGARKAGEPEHPRVDDALVAQVVDREHGGRVRECALLGVVRAHEGRRPRRLLVVRVQDVERLAEALDRLYRRAREEEEALGVVRVALARGRVVIEPGAVEEAAVAGMVHEQHARLVARAVGDRELRGLVPHAPGHERAGEIAELPASGHGEVAPVRHRHHDAVPAPHLLG